MNGRRRINDAINMLDKRKDDKPIRISGMLGTIINGVYVIHIPSRPGFVWVRLRNSSNEIIQAYSSLVSPIYDLPVIVERDPLDPTRYNIIGRDVGRYDSWGVANSPAYTNPVYQTTYYPSFYNDSVFVASTGTVIDFGANLNVAVTGSVIFISAVDTVNGSHVIVYEDSAFKATGTAINFGENINVAVTGTMVFVSSIDTVGGGGSDLLIYDDITFKVTGTAINFGSNLEVSVTGSTAYVQAVGGGFSGELSIYDDSTFKVTGTAISFDNNLSVAVTGTMAYVSSSGGGNPGEGHITILAASYSDASGTFSMFNNASAIYQSYLANSNTASGSAAYYNLYMDAGTYSLLIYYHKSANGGIFDVDIDNTEVVSIDGYADPAAYNFRSLTTGIVIADAGIKTMRVRLDGKNASSSGYVTFIAYYALWRTA